MNTKNILVVLALSVAGTAAWAESKIWVATADGNASSAENWDPNGVPGAGDTIVLDGARSLRAMTWDAGANGLPAQVAAWEQSSSYTGTVTFLTTYPGIVDNNFKVFTVSGDATLAGGKWTHPANADKEVWRLCMDIGGNLTIDGGAAIDCSLKGYAATNYPAGSQPGSHGGALDHAWVYGDLKEPVNLGAGGWWSAAEGGKGGGGAIHLTVGGTVTVAKGGAIRADGAGWTGVKYHFQNAMGGAGGSVYIKAKTLSLDGNISANGSYNGRFGKGGAGGRVALDLTEQDFGKVNFGNLSAKCLGSMENPGCGTVFVRTPDKPNGLLYLADDVNVNAFCSRNIDAPSITGGCSIPSNTTWTLDGIRIAGGGTFAILAVPPGTKLALPGGWASVEATTYSLEWDRNGSYYCGGISYQGGALEVPTSADGTNYFQKGWGFEALVPYTITGNVVVATCARLGTLCHRATPDSYPYSQITVLGDVDVRMGQWNGNPNRNKRGLISTLAGGLGIGLPNHAGIHGGQSGAVSDPKAYGSIFAPKEPGEEGYTGSYSTHGSGALKLTVTGTLNVDGTVEAGATGHFYAERNGNGGGGSLDITCARLTGSGQILANGTRTGSIWNTDNPASIKPAGAPGRIAIRLTDPAAKFETFGLENIQAMGWHGGAAEIDGQAQSNYYVSAGTVYLQDARAGEKAGTIYVRDMEDTNGVNTASFTPIPSVKFKESDPDEDFSAATLDVSSYARVKITRDLTVKTLDVSGHGTIDLNGCLLTAKRRCLVDGQPLAPGRYTAEQLAARGLPFKDTCEEKKGMLKISRIFVLLLQ